MRNPWNGGWWPATTTPPGTGPWPQRPVENTGKAGSIRCELNTAQPKTKLCGFDYPTETPVVVEVSVVLADALSESKDVEFCALATNQTTPGPVVTAAGQLIIEYGSGGVVQRAVLDLRSGNYQLPPCEQVRVYFETSRQESGGVLPAMNVSACLATGYHPAPSTPTYTMVNYAAPTTGWTITIPNRAKFVDLWAANASTSANLYGAGAPVLSLIGTRVQSQLIRDLTTGIWAPPYPVGCFAAGYTDGETYRTVVVDTTVICAAVVQFQLEL